MRDRIVVVAAAVLLFVACTSDPDASIEAPDSVSSIDADASTAGVVAGENEPPVQSTTATAGAAAPTTVRQSTTSASETSAPAVTTRNTAAPTTSPSTDDPEVVGDGPVLTNLPAPGDETGEAPPAPTGLVPAFFAFDATVTTPCSGSASGIVRIQWEVVGSESVDIAIDDIDRPVLTQQPPAGQADLALNCAGTTYFVIAANAEGRANRSITLP